MKHILSFLSWLSVLLLWWSAASVYVSPASYGRFFSLAGLAFPIFLAMVIGSGLLCLLFAPRQVWIALLGIAVCIGSVRDYFPLNLSSPPPKNTLKVISYNTMGLNNWKMDDNKRDYEVLRYLLSQQPDIVCMQEVGFEPGYRGDTVRIKENAERYGYYFRFGQAYNNVVAVASRFRIVKTETVCASESNGAVAFYLLRKNNDTLVVVNAHLQSMHLSDKMRNEYTDLIKNPENGTKDIHSKVTLLSYIANNGVVRAEQADKLADFIDRHKDKPLIVMGDFNDTPISYAHHKVCTRLTDALRATSNGIGRSFNRNAIYVRIDNAFCSKHFKPYAFRVDNSVPFSDHYPVIGYLKEQ